MTLAKWDRLAMQDPFSRLFESVITAPWVDQPNRASEPGDWAPAVDVSSDRDGYVFQFDLPGVDKDAIDVSIDQGVLKVSGERRSQRTVGEGEEDQSTHRLERVFGRFSRAFKLPGDADAGRVTASYVNGVLELRIAKQESAKPRRIEISQAN